MYTSHTYTGTLMEATQIIKRIFDKIIIIIIINNCMKPTPKSHRSSLYFKKSSLSPKTVQSNDINKSTISWLMSSLSSQTLSQSSSKG